MRYIDNIKKWTKASLEENVKVADELCCAGGAANVGTDDTD